MADICVHAQLEDKDVVETASLICNVPNSLHLGYCQVGVHVADIRKRYIIVNHCNFPLPDTACSFISLSNGTALVICENYDLVAFNENGILAQKSLGTAAQTRVKPYLTVDQTGVVATVVAHNYELLFFTVLLDNEVTPESAEFRQLQATRAMGVSNIALVTGKSLSMDSKEETNDLLWTVNNGLMSRLKVEEISLREPVPSRYRNEVGKLPLRYVPTTIYPWSAGDVDGILIVNADSIVLATLKDVLSGNGNFQLCPVPEMFAHSLLRTDNRTRIFVLSPAGLAEIVVGESDNRLEMLHIADLPAEFTRLEYTIKVDSMFVRINDEDELELSCHYNNFQSDLVFDLMVNKGQVDIMFLKARPEKHDKVIKMAKLCYDRISKEVAGYSTDVTRAILLKFGELATSDSRASVAVPGIRHASFLPSKSLAILSDESSTMCFKASGSQNTLKLGQIEVPELRDCVVLATLSLETGDIIATNKGLKLCARYGLVNAIKTEDIELASAEASNSYLCCMTLHASSVRIYSHNLSSAEIRVDGFPIFCRISSDDRVIIGCANHKIYLFKICDGLAIEPIGSREFDSSVHDALLFPNSDILAVSFSRGTWAAVDINKTLDAPVECMRNPGKSALRFFASPVSRDLFACSTGVYRISKDTGLILPLLSNEGSNKSLECSEVDLLFTVPVGDRLVLLAATPSQLVPLPFLPSERHDIGSIFFDLPLCQTRKGSIVSLHLVSRIRCWMISRQEALDFIDMRSRLPLNWCFNSSDELEAGLKICDSFSWRFCHENNPYEHVVLIVVKSKMYEIRTYTFERVNVRLKLTRRLRKLLYSDSVHAVVPSGDNLIVYKDGKVQILSVISEDGKARLSTKPGFTLDVGSSSSGYSSSRLAIVGSMIFVNSGTSIYSTDTLNEENNPQKYQGDYSLLRSGTLSGESVLIVVERQTILHVFRLNRNKELTCVFVLQMTTPLADVIQVGDKAGASSLMLLDQNGSLNTVVIVPKLDFLDNAFKLKLLV